jgi:S-formylglutathione hydrolase FrmB
MSRRGFVITGASVLALAAVGGAAAAVNERILPGRSTMYRLLGLDGADGAIPDVKPVPTSSGSFRSAARAGTETGWTVAAPAGEKSLPVVVALHGYSGNHSALFGDQLGLDRFLAAHIDAGGAPFAIASVDGGNAYWHPRADGDDPAAMVVDEFIPRLTAMGFDTDRLGFTGYSMGGYGALRFAWKLGRERVRVATALSPALWTDARDAAHGAFDGTADFDANTVLGRQRQLDGISLRIDCGTGDGFEPAVQRYRSGFAAPPAGGFEPGGHDMGYWRRMAPAHLTHLAHALQP